MLLLTVISVSLSLIASEALVRFIYKNEIVLFPRYHTAANYGEFIIRRLRPNTVFWHTSIDGTWKFVTNSQGFRDERDWHYDKPKGRLRILSLGDSHTEGFEVRQEHTFSAVIERFLKNKGVDAEILNAGISGFGTAESLAFLETEGIRYRPDIVVLGLYANDYQDNIKAGLFRVDRGKLVVVKREHTPGVKILDVINAIPVLRWLSENSYFYNFALNTIWESAKQMLLHEAEGRIATEYAIQKGDISGVEKELMRVLLKRMYEFCNARGIKLIILDIPALSAENQFVSSILDDVRNDVRGASHKLIESVEILGRYRNLTEIHVPHGHNHISEFTHTMLGTATASVILTLIPSAHRSQDATSVTR